MPYIKQTIYAGKTVEIHKYYSSRYGKRTTPTRRPHTEKTSEAVAEVNRQQSIKKLRGLLNANFSFGDMHCIFTYRQDMRPDADEAKKRYKQLMYKLKKAYKSCDVEFKYIAVTEYEEKAIHHHIVLKNIDVKILRACWKWGKVFVTPLDETGQYGKLAEYLVKETDKSAKKPDALYRKRWNASQNLEKPLVTREVIKAQKWQKEPKVPNGFYVWKEKDIAINTIDNYTQLPRQDYILVRLC